MKKGYISEYMSFDTTGKFTVRFMSLENVNDKHTAEIIIEGGIDMDEIGRVLVVEGEKLIRKAESLKFNKPD